MTKIAHGNYDSLIECLDSKTNRWKFIWNITTDDNGQVYNYEIIDHKPSLSEIKDTINTWYNYKTEQAILSGFEWNGHKVWLSIENQTHYKAMYDLAVYTSTLPTFKFGIDSPDYYTFTSIQELADFCIKSTQFIENTLQSGREEKDSINWEEYQTLLN